VNIPDNDGIVGPNALQDFSQLHTKIISVLLCLLIH